MAIKILLAHYEPKIRTEIRRKLESWGFVVEEAGDGETVRRKLEMTAPSLILAYAPLPKINTPDLIRELRKAPDYQHIPILVFSDIFRSRKLTEELRALGAVEFIEWPTTDDVFRNFLETVVQRYEIAPKTPETRRIQRSKDILDEEIEKKLAQTLSGVLGPTRLKKRKPKREKLESSEPEDASQVEAPSEEGKAVESTPAPPEEQATRVLTAEELFGDLLTELESAEEEPSLKAATVPGVEPEASSETRAINVEELEQEIGKIIESTLSGPRIEETSEEVEKPAEAEEPPFEAETAESQSEPEMPGLRDESLTRQMEAPVIPEPTSTTHEPSIQETSTESPVESIQDEAVEEDAAQTLVLEHDRETLAEGIPFGPYILIERIATGGMAELFKAKKKGVQGFEKIVAIKRILPHLADNEEFITMFIDEAKLVAGLTHPNIAQIYDLGQIGHDYYIAMEFVDGKDLRTVFREAKKQGKTIPLPVACLIASRICAALDYAHRARDSAGRPLHVVHRDVSPQNVLISFDGEVKLTDFGVAKAAIKAHQTMIGALKGKLLYMSPEQAWGKPVDGRSDIFSVGVILYEMLTGETLFYQKGDNEVSILEKVRSAEVPPIQAFRPDLPDDLVKIVHRSLAKDPAERYQRAGDMQRELERFLAREGYLDTPLLVAQFVCELFRDEAGERLPQIEAKLRDLTPAPSFVPEQELPGEGVSEAVDKDIATQKTMVVESEEKRYIPADEESGASTAAGPALIEAATEAAPEEIVYPEKERPSPRRTPWVIPLVIVLGIGLVVAAFFLMRKPTMETKAETKPAVVTPTPPSAEAMKPASKSPTAPVGEEETSAQTEQTPSVSPSKEKTPETSVPKTEAKAVQKLPQALSKPKQKPKLEKAKPKKPISPKVEKITRSAPVVKKAIPEKTPVKQTVQSPPEGTAPEKPAPKKPAETETISPEAVQQREATPETKEEVTDTKAASPAEEKPSEAEPSVETLPPPIETKPAEPPVKTGDLIETPEVPPKELRRKKAIYPLIARRNRWRDTVILRVLVDENGRPIRAIVLRSQYKILADAAVEAAMASKFLPARHRGVRVKSWISMTFIFTP